MLLALAATSHACAPVADGGPLGQTPALPPPALMEAVDAALAQTAAAALPGVSLDRAWEVADWIDLAATGGRAGERAARALAGDDPAELSGALLTLLESRENAVELRRSAYAWLRERAVAAALPRLTLRLKYEKDWVANVDLALGLLRLGSGAGLEALANILRADASHDPTIMEARTRAAAALAHLPPAPDWTPGDFAADWQRLLAVQAEWASALRPLRAFDPEEAAGVTAETWRMIERLRSQPLRPVDDARFVLTRLPLDCSGPPLLAAAFERDLYVRDHALETLSWIGAPVGRWAAATGCDAIGILAPLLGDEVLRPRVLEALGALGRAEAAALLLPWLASRNTENLTAAADALLRCAGADALPDLVAALERGGPWPTEAAYSLALLRQALDPSAPAPDPGRLDTAEARRREAWRAARPEINR